ncbi:GyrI-like domain-containing protein [Georgenia sp. TF02-10]|uniref:GyrI-like domain-containing protein n=1 Tax=Georgenia sp. TF02-10 TaxID=2917725 RepID=UPI001FA7947A|nr:GyrI-like domain-containing protein [Georgenia sp. TF02-10]UNX55027.1 GyrI-like domain-containing protein [Georgenia sp. TF02-10]
MTDIAIIDVLPEHTVGIRRTARTAEITDFFDSVFHEVFGALQAAGVEPTGAPFARYRGTPGETADIEGGFPVAAPFQATGELVAGTLPAARAIEAVHVGGYGELPQTYERIEAWAAEQGVQLLEDMWERYDAGPASDPDPATWRTRIVWPVSGPPVTAE